MHALYEMPTPLKHVSRWAKAYIFPEIFWDTNSIHVITPGIRKDSRERRSSLSFLNQFLKNFLTRLSFFAQLGPYTTAKSPQITTKRLSKAQIRLHKAQTLSSITWSEPYRMIYSSRVSAHAPQFSLSPESIFPIRSTRCRSCAPDLARRRPGRIGGDHSDW